MSDPTQQSSPSPDSSGSDADQPQPFIITMPDDPASGADWYLWAAVLALITLVAFWPAINGGFLWDDDQYVTQNRALLDASGLKDIWKIPPGTIQYYPLTFTAFWIEHQIWGNNPLGYRVVNLLLHAGSAIILWRILRRLKIPGAWPAAAIWAVHPIQAESVCWISECKNVLSGVLALASVYFYLDFAGIRDPANDRRTWNLTADWQTYAIGAALFILAMLAKTAVVFLPIAILAILWWKKRLSLPRILGVIPMLIIGAALAWETSIIETNPNGAIRATGPQWDLTMAQRWMISGRDFWFYIGKLLAPIHQSFIYPRIEPSPHDSIQWLYPVAAIVVLILLYVASRKIGRGAFTAAICYLLLIFPALGFFTVYPFRYSFVADHFQYLAGIPVIALGISIIAGILAPLWKKRAPAGEQPITKTSPAIAVLAAILLIVLGCTAWIRADVFSDSSKLWADVLQPDKNPNSWLAAYNLARSLQSDAKSGFDEAARLLQGGDKDSSKENADAALDSLDASDHLLQRVLDNPSTPDDVLYKARDLWAQNDVTRLRSPDSKSAEILSHALDQLKLAMASPTAADDPLPRYTLGIVDRNLADGIEQKSAPATRAATVPATTRPYAADERKYIDLLLASRDNFQQAMHLSESGLNSPAFGPESSHVLPLAALESGNIDWKLAELAHDHANVNEENRYSKDAVEDYSQAVRSNPTSVEAHYQLALAMENVNDLDDAKEQLMDILRDLDHYNAKAYNEVGRVILESGPTNMTEFEAAVESFKAAIKFDPNLIGARKNLEMALKMLASTRPATRTTTGPSTKP
jgi:tetratricopeptide (TPR) repeat protein